MSSKSIEIKITSGFTNTGFAQALQAIDLLLKDLGRVNAAISGGSGRGGNQGFSKLGQSAQTAARQTDSAAKEIAASLRKIESAFNQGLKAAKDFDAGLRTKGAAADRLQRALGEVAAAERELRQAEEALQRIEKEGKVSQEQRKLALDNYTNAISRSRMARRELAASSQQTERGIERESQGYAKLVVALEEVEDRLQGMQGTEKGYDAALDRRDDLLAQVEQAERKMTESLAQQARQTAEASQGMARANQIITQGISGRAHLAGVVQQLNTQQKAAAAAAKSVQAALSPLNRIFATLAPVVARLAQTLGGNLVRAAHQAASALGGLMRSAGSQLANLTKSLSQAGRSFLNFGNDAQVGFGKANRSAMEFYAAGFSLLMAGSTARGFGQGMFGRMTGGINDYTEYEKNLTRAAIAASASNPTMQKFVFGLQNGDFGKQVTQFSTQDLALGAYFYGSALGQPINEGNMGDVSKQLIPLLQLAAFAGTNPETAIKGVLNMGLEFGLDPRDMAQSGDIAKLAAQTAYLANKSTMEPTDIFEMFKMVGPQLHRISGDEAGAGLTDAMAFAFFASEAGMRGGQVGRGLSQMIASLTDPTDKMTALAAETWGIENNRDAFRSLFFNDKGDLRGGLLGVLSKFMDPRLSGSADELLASMFTQNATRGTIGAIEGMRSDPGRWQQVVAELSGPNATKFLEGAFEQTSSTLFSHIQDLKNKWFQVNAAIIGNIQGPLIKAISAISNALKEVGDIFADHPLFGKLLAGGGALVAGIATLGGTLLSMAGTILILGRAFKLTHGAGHILLSFLASLPHLLLIGIPLFLALAAAAVLLKRAWDTNFLGIQDRLKKFSGNFSETFKGALDTVERFIQAFSGVFAQRVNQAFDDFIERTRDWKDEWNDFLAFAKAFGTGFVVGFVGAFAAVKVAAEAAFDAIGRAIKLLPDISTNTAQIVGIIFGTLFGVTLIRSILPFGAAIEALGVRVLVFAAQGAAAFLSFGASVLVAMAPILPLVGLLAALGVAFYIGWTQSEQFRTGIIQIAEYLGGGLVTGIGIGLAAVAALGLVLVKGLSFIDDYVAKLGTFRDGLFALGVAIGVMLVAPLVVAAAEFMLNAVLIAAAVMAIVKVLDVLFSSNRGFSEWVADIASEMQKLYTVLVYGGGWDMIGDILVARIGQALDKVGETIFRKLADIAESLTNSINLVPGVGSALKIAGIDIGSISRKPFDAMADEYVGRYTMYQQAIDDAYAKAEAARQAQMAQMNTLPSKSNSFQALLDQAIHGGGIDLGEFWDSLFGSIKGDPRLKSIKSDILEALGFSGKNPNEINLSDIVKIAGGDSAFIEQVRAAMRESGLNPEEIDKVFAEAGQGAGDAGAAAGADYGDSFVSEFVKKQMEIKGQWDSLQFQMPTFANMLAGGAPRSAIGAPSLLEYFGLNADAINQGLQQAAQDAGGTPTDLFALLFGSDDGVIRATNQHGKNILKSIYGDKGFMSGLEAAGMSPEDFAKLLPFHYAADPAVVGLVQGQLVTGLNAATRGALLDAEIDPNDLAQWISSNIGNPDGWNLQHYIEEVKGLTPEEARDWLERKLGTNQWGDIVHELSSDEGGLFAGLETVLVDGFGNVVGMTYEAFEGLPEIIDGPLGKTVEVTQEQFDKLDPIVKGALAAAGVHFVTIPQGWADQLEDTTPTLAEAIRRGLEVGMEDLDMDGILDRYVVDPITKKKIKLPVPELEWSDWGDGTEQIKNQFATAYDNALQEAADDTTEATNAGTTLATATGQAFATTLPTEINKALEGQGATFNLDDEFDFAGKNAAQKFGESFGTNLPTQINKSLEGNGATFGLSDEFEFAGKNAAQVFAGAFATSIATSLATIDISSMLSGTPSVQDATGGTGGAGSADDRVSNSMGNAPTPSAQTFTVTLTLDKTAFDTALGNAIIGIQGFAAQPWTTKLLLDKAVFDTDLWNAIQAALGVQATIFTTTLTLDKSAFDNDLWNAITAILGVQATVFTTTLTLDKTSFDDSLWTAIQAALGFQNTTFTTTLDADEGPAWWTVSTLISEAGIIGQFDGSSYSTNLYANDYASGILDAIIDKLGTINGYQAVATVSINQNITSSGSVNQAAGGTPQFAGGGIFRGPGSYFIAGEDGPELIKAPWGTKIYSSSQTASMLNSKPAAQNGNQGGGGTSVNIYGDVHIRSDADINKLAERIDYLQGKKNERAARTRAVDLGSLNK